MIQGKVDEDEAGDTRHRAGPIKGGTVYAGLGACGFGQTLRRRLQRGRFGSFGRRDEKVGYHDQEGADDGEDPEAPVPGDSLRDEGRKDGAHSSSGGTSRAEAGKCEVPLQSDRVRPPYQGYGVGDEQCRTDSWKALNVLNMMRSVVWQNPQMRDHTENHAHPIMNIFLCPYMSPSRPMDKRCVSRLLLRSGGQDPPRRMGGRGGARGSGDIPAGRMRRSPLSCYTLPRTSSDFHSRRC